VLRGVHFDFNNAKIRPGDAAVLDKAAATLKQNPNVTVNVNGYSDAIGGEEYNPEAVRTTCRCGRGLPGESRNPVEPVDSARLRQNQLRRPKRHA
jgi:OmpA family